MIFMKPRRKYIKDAENRKKLANEYMQMRKKKDENILKVQKM